MLERSGTALEARGAGIGLHPMTTRYFDESSDLDAAMVEIELPWLQFLSASGDRIYRERMNYRFSSWNTIYRGLVRCFDESRYHLGCEVSGFDQDDRGVTVRLSDGEAHGFDMLVCADGISSQARATLLPGAETRYAGYVAWRATVPESELSRSTFEAFHDSITYSLLPSGHVLVYPIPNLDGALEPGRRLANLVWYHNYGEGDALDDLMTDRHGQRHGLSLPPGAVRDEHVAWTKEFADVHMAPAFAEILHRTPEPFVQVIYDIDVERMAFGRVVLIGDAAFAVRPHAAAGTAKACADAWALRDALRDAGAATRWTRSCAGSRASLRSGGSSSRAPGTWGTARSSTGAGSPETRRSGSACTDRDGSRGGGRPFRATAARYRLREIAASRADGATPGARASRPQAGRRPAHPEERTTLTGHRQPRRCHLGARASVIRLRAGGTHALPRSGNPPDAWTGAPPTASRTSRCGRCGTRTAHASRRSRGRAARSRLRPRCTCARCG